MKEMDGGRKRKSLPSLLATVSLPKNQMQKRMKEIENEF
jgi:hypothetical protein